ncbi:MAG: RsmG family class I SAM-dependent methyltransferase [Myxococcota bacterium]
MNIWRPFLQTWSSKQKSTAIQALEEPRTAHVMQQYIQRLQQWNKKVRLTGKDDPQSLWMHIIDSLIALPLFQTTTDLDAEASVSPAVSVRSTYKALDIGSGAGFPAIPLSICAAHGEWTLLESRQRRASFLQQTCRQLQCNAQVQTLFFSEQQQPTNGPFDIVTFRAVAPNKILEALPQILSPNGLVLYWGTSQSPTFPSPFQCREVIPYSLDDAQQLRLYIYCIS